MAFAYADDIAYTDDLSYFGDITAQPVFFVTGAIIPARVTGEVVA